MTASFVATATATGPPEKRLHALLSYYGPMSWGGWASLAYYYRDRDDDTKYLEIAKETDALYPEYRRLGEVYTVIDSQDFDSALVVARRPVELHPYQPDFLQVLGNVYGKLDDYQQAEEYYLKAIRLKPHHVIMNELGQLYVRQHKYKQALASFRRAHNLAPEASAILDGMGLTYYLPRLQRLNQGNCRFAVLGGPGFARRTLAADDRGAT